MKVSSEYHYEWDEVVVPYLRNVCPGVMLSMIGSGL